MKSHRNPDETIHRILETSLKLFIEKGYEQTSIQDIIDDLGNLTKGAIYHHFKSKEDILVGVSDLIYGNDEAVFQQICEDQTLTGMERLRKLLQYALKSNAQDDMFQSAPNLLDNPKFLALILRENIINSVPMYIAPMIEAGIQDGSIRTKYPKQIAEVIMLLINIWLNPLVFHSSPDEMLQKVLAFQDFMKTLGFDLFDEESIQVFVKFSQLYQSHATPETP